MPKFRINCPVTSVRGSQAYIVEAKDAEDAIRLHDLGESTFEEQEIEVMALGEPEVEEVEEKS